MRAAISTEGSFVSPHFGRCPSFTLVDIENGKAANRTEVENPGYTPGFIPQFLHEKVLALLSAEVWEQGRQAFLRSWEY